MRVSFRQNERTGFFVPNLRRVFGCFEPHEIAASRDLVGEFVRRPLPQSPVRTALIIFSSPALDDLPGFGQGREPVGIQAFGLFSKRRRNIIRAYERIAERLDAVNYSDPTVVSALGVLVKRVNDQKAVEGVQSAEQKATGQQCDDQPRAASFETGTRPGYPLRPTENRQDAVCQAPPRKQHPNRLSR